MTTDKLKEINQQIREHCTQLPSKEGYCPAIATETNGHVICWHATPPGTVANNSCPPHDSFDPHRYAYKECWPNGTWFIHPDSKTGRDWTNYTNCINKDELEKFQTKKSNNWKYGSASYPIIDLIDTVLFMFPNLALWYNLIYFTGLTSFIIEEQNNINLDKNDLRAVIIDKIFVFHTYINKLFVIGYSVSLVALIISLLIFLIFRSLKCTRIRIHIQLFLSFIMNNIMWVIWYREVIPRSERFNDENPIWCQALEIFLRYFLIANYMWMFCEGLYLHISLVVVFVRDEVAWKWFLLIGWGIPFIVVFIYATVRIFYLQDTKGCWLITSKAELIYSIPVYITLTASLIFLINVLRVILTIMHPNSDNPAPARVKKAARAALILIPLFGLQYVLIPFRPDKGDAYAHLYDYVTVVVTSLQGLCVSCLFCFANQDVHHAVMGCINRKLYASGWSNYQYTGAMDSAGVYVINGNHSNSIRML